MGSGHGPYTHHRAGRRSLAGKRKGEALAESLPPSHSCFNSPESRQLRKGFAATHSSTYRASLSEPLKRTPPEIRVASG